MAKRLYLIDGMALLFRSYYALIATPLTSNHGEPTGGTFGFCSALVRLLEQHKPDLIAVAWDHEKPTFRHEQFTDYKANRPAFPDDMIPQLKRVKEIVGYYHIPCLEGFPGFEADDIIGTLAHRAAAEGYEVYCVTPDKDFFQLVTEKIFVYRPSKPGADAEMIDIEGVKRKFGVAPEQVIDVLALIGDASDNVPGVKGIGEKTAIPLIQQYGTIDNLYEHIEEIPKAGVKKKLLENRDNAFMSKELVTIHTEVPFDVTFDELRLDLPDIPKLLQVYQELDLRTLVNRYRDQLPEVAAGAVAADAADQEGSTQITDDAGAVAGEEVVFGTIADVKYDYHIIRTEEELKEAVDYLVNGPVLAFDLETDSLDWQSGNIIGFALSTRTGEGFYVPVANEQVVEKIETGSLFDTEETKAATEGLLMDVCLRYLAPLFESESLPKTGQNAKFDALYLCKHNVHVTPIAFDSMLASYVIDSTQQHGMDALAERYLGYKPISITELIGARGKGQLNMRDIDLETVGRYAAEDADVTIQLYERLQQELKEHQLDEVATKYEFPLVEVLTEMEYTGVYIDMASLKDISKTLEATMANVEQEIYEIAGHRFNIGSPKQLGEVLFEELQLPTKKKTKTGYSTDQFVMEELAALHPLPEKILEYRQASKLKSTYVDALPSLINTATGRVHTSYNQAVTSTGRLSSVNPNLQNIPIRSDIGREIRKAFVPGIPDGAILSADYSQIELRIMAHICGDEALVKAFKENFDIHTAAAMNVFGVTAEEVTGNMRRKAKEVNFGIMYGIGPFGLARRLKIERAEAQELIKTYFEKYPGVNQYINSTLEMARSRGYVETLSGRRRFYPNINARNQSVRGAEERAAINMPIQGSSADIIKLAMIHIHRDLPKHFPRAHMLLQVHDELVFEGPKEEMDELSAFVKEKMEGAFSLGEVRLVAETGVGGNWFEAH